jgi:phosphatidylserine/phosphatidylglycerophosphate/cardiolipin synthase-like enzyme
MNKYIFIFALILFQCSNQNQLKYSVHFSPKGGCEESIVQLIHSAKKSIKIQAYGFTNANIIKALIYPNPGVQVQVILDKSDAKGDGFVEGASIASFSFGKVYIDKKHAIAHNKVIILDSEVVETGSYNFTENAELHNAENCLIIYDANLAKQYEDNWDLHLKHSEPLKLPD